MCMFFICCNSVLLSGNCRECVWFQVWEVFEVSCHEGVTECWDSEYQCTEEALMNSEESDRDVLRHRTEVITSYRRKTFGVTEHLKSQGSVAETLLWTEPLRSSVGALPRGYRVCVRKELCCEFRKTRILLRILRSSVWRTSSEVWNLQGESVTIVCSVAEILRQEGVERVCR